ncbi:hypothetical protein Tco_1565269 [Tanacetum coccineum]
MEDISSEAKCFSSPLYVTTITGLPFSPIILKGQTFMSPCTMASSYLLPINRFASENSKQQKVNDTKKSELSGHLGAVNYAPWAAPKLQPMGIQLRSPLEEFQTTTG